MTEPKKCFYCRDTNLDALREFMDHYGGKREVAFCKKHAAQWDDTTEKLDRHEREATDA